MAMLEIGETAGKLLSKKIQYLGLLCIYLHVDFGLVFFNPKPLHLFNNLYVSIDMLCLPHSHREYLPVPEL